MQIESTLVCRCGHPSSLHTERGCRGSRFQVCRCNLDAIGALRAAVESARFGVVKKTVPDQTSTV